MREVAVRNGHVTGYPIPRGWVIIGLALACWAALIGFVAFSSHVFSFLMAL